MQKPAKHQDIIANNNWNFSTDSRDNIILLIRYEQIVHGVVVLKNSLQHAGKRHIKNSKSGIS